MKPGLEPSGPLPLLAAEEIARLRDEVALRSEELAQEIGWLEQIELVQPPAGTPPGELHVVVFNAERGSRFDGIRTLLTEHPELRGADVVLLSEVDWGMARSGNRHVARELAEALGLGYAFGIEFLELTKGEALELEAPGENTYSFHGNAILSRWPLVNVRIVRLPRYCSWASGSQQRIGGRMALLADLATEDGAITLASVHLENRTDPVGRQMQMRAVLEAIPPDSPAIVAGDLNTSTIDAGVDEQIFSVPMLLQENPERLRRPQAWEPLFDEMRGAGFLVDEINPPGATSVPMGIPDPTYWLKLDWIFARGLRAVSSSIIAAEHEGERVSDHDFLATRFAASQA